MAINDNQQHNAGNSVLGQQFQKQQQQQQKRMDFNSVLANLSGGYVAPGAGGEYFIKFREALTTVGKDLMSDDLSAKVLSLNRQEMPNLRFSILVLCVEIKSIPNKMGYHTLILEGTGEPLKTEMKVIDNQQVRIRHTTSDAYDPILVDAVSSLVASNYPNVRALSSSAQVVPSTVTVDKTDVVEAIVRNAAMACVTNVLQDSKALTPLSLQTMSHDTRTVLDMAVGNSDVYDEVAAPVRASVQVTLSTQRKDNRTFAEQLQVVNSADNTTRICDMTGFVNPIWAPMQYGQPMMGQMYPGMMPGMYQQDPSMLPKLVAEFVVTGVKSPYTTSLAAVILGLSSFLVLTDNNNWVQSLLPSRNAARPKQGQTDITDIGALNTICNIANETEKGIFGTPVSIEAMGGDLLKINQYISRLFRPGAIVSLDCQEHGPSSWYMDIFAAAALGDQDAATMIIEAADELTDGLFSQHLENGPMFQNTCRVPLGYYVTGEQKRDIRNIDLTAICNLFQSNPAMIHEYSATFVNRPGMGPLANLAAREGLIEHACVNQCSITGYALRCTLSNSFNMALSKAIAAMGINTIINTPLSADQLRTGTPTPDYINGAVTVGTNTFMNMGGIGRMNTPMNTIHFNRMYGRG